MAQMRVFVSHSHEDDAFCRPLVQKLRGAGVDVWYDEDNLNSGQLLATVERELRERPVFVVLLSPAALQSHWVRDETKWAYARLRRDPTRLILPVTAKALGDADNIWLFLQDFKRIEAPGAKPYPLPEAISRTLHALQLTSPGEPQPSDAPDPTESIEDLITRGKALQAQGKHAEALPLFGRAARLDPRSAEAWSNVAFALAELARFAEAHSAFRRALDEDPNNGTVWNRDGEVLVQLGRFDEALAAFDRALALEPDNASAWGSKGAALSKLHRYEEAVVALNRALSLGETAIPWTNKGVALVAVGRHGEALVAFEHALELDPNNADTWVHKGIALRDLHRYDEALVACDRALALDSMLTIAWVNKGAALIGLKRYEEALTAFDRALTLDPTLAVAWNYKALALRELGRRGEAEVVERRMNEFSG